jgi:hypothetical protein
LATALTNAPYSLSATRIFSACAELENDSLVFRSD